MALHDLVPELREAVADPLPRSSLIGRERGDDARRKLLPDRDSKRPRITLGCLEVAALKRRRGIRAAGRRAVYRVKHQGAVTHGPRQRAVDRQTEPVLSQGLQRDPATRRLHPDEPTASGWNPDRAAA